MPHAISPRGCGSLGHLKGSLPWTCVLLDDEHAPQRNAFAVPAGGRVVFYTSLIKKIDATFPRMPYDSWKREDALAFMFAHEVGHVLARHGMEKLTLGLLSYCTSGAHEFGKPNSTHRSNMTRITNLVETEADRIAVWLLGQGGYSCDAAVHGVKVLQRMSRNPGELEDEPLERTHPLTSARMQAVLAERERYESLGLEGLAKGADCRRRHTSKHPGVWLVASLATLVCAGDSQGIHSLLHVSQAIIPRVFIGIPFFLPLSLALLEVATYFLG